MLNEGTKTIIEWLTDSNTCYLLGAGCSKCANKDLMEDLSSKIRANISKIGQNTFDELNGADGRKATVEDLIDYLLQLKKVIKYQKKPNIKDWTVEKIQDEIELIQKEIVALIGCDWKGNKVHEAFFDRLHRFSGRIMHDIFTLNYDTIIEASLESQKIHYSDGFIGFENAYFDPTIYETVSTGSPLFRLYKLHGSVNWYRDEDDTVRRRPTSGSCSANRLVIYPSEQKYVDTQYGVYEKLMGKFRERLRVQRNNNNLVVIGYSFGDEHINRAIIDSLKQSSFLTVYAFVGQNADIEKQKNTFEEMAKQCEDRFNVFIGNQFHVGPALMKEEWEKVKTLDLWKFENLVALLSGGQS